ncbi:MAG: phosphodiester glycosidase family protein [Spirochaetaceae bacterium]|nr:phosphodiester glycosidase family protein [Spirochaetaceae bacterium]
MAFDADKSISYQKITLKDVPLIVHLVQVDLSRHLSVVASDGKETQYVKDFARDTEVSVAINANPFTSDKTPVGIWQNKDGVISPKDERYDAVGFFLKNGKIAAKIFPNQEVTSTEDLIFVAGGFWQILKKGIIQEFKEVYDTRAAVGFNDEYMYFMVIEGEFPQESRGATFEETAEIFLKLGCNEAFMFDGGGSAALAVNGKLQNRVWLQRKVPCILGIKINQ